MRFPTCFYLYRSFAAAIVLVLTLGAQQEALAWGATGHRMISRMAIETLSVDIPAFLRTSTAIGMIGELGREPDRSKGTGNSHDHDLDPGHYVNISDDFTIGGFLPLESLPPTREDYDTNLRSSGSNEYQAGYLPYAIIDGWQQLQRDFGYWRADRAAERMAKSSADRAWFANDRRLRELIIVRDLGYWSHFVADASQPMHVSVHHDGWGDFPNPKNYGATPGFHARFEGAFVTSHVFRKDVVKKLRPYRDCACSIQARTVDYLRDTHAQVMPMFDLEKAGAFSEDVATGKDFVADRLAAAISELRDLIEAAWRISADSSVGYPPVPVRDVESGRTNPIEQMRGRD